MFRRLFTLHLKKQILEKKQTGNCNQVTNSNLEIIERKNLIFTREQERQLEAIGRVEKIPIQVKTSTENLELLMNKDISTPYDCCKHISLPVCQQSALALINDEFLWDMHRPLPGECTIQFLTFKDEDPYSLNKAFWRTGSFVLGAVISKAFKENVKIHLHSFPPPYIKSGSFIYDVVMNVDNWVPTIDELRILSAEFILFVQGNHKIERLKVKKSIAIEIFEDNPYKLAQIPEIARQAEDKMITLYRVNDHIDISNGPMVADTSFFGKCSITNVIGYHNGKENIYRFQGIALPKGILLNNFAYKILEERGASLNEAKFPGQPDKLSFVGKPISEKDVPKSIDEIQMT
ncbi:mitochondrial 50S ribosomal protein L39, putative [Pediculus humanus corporis]|uniref:Mitochondrial 50S ribosomal protein L39, putative n=1 Tax=Pediculus humanus subsp. corporis TaxID=121224 RepID=E0VYY1_PEDHC|nr:mitochondrial 50S ribosomal protein L39, putative [Pediculus humanus corporis]EEB18587.1 mitochondrial 50S ribosomal protein L39, putative [Pediculus humanus corporis]